MPFKYILNQENNTLSLTELANELAVTKTEKLSVRLLEISGVENPGDLTINIIENGDENVIPLARYRTRFVHENDQFLLDTSEVPFFNLDVSQPNLWLKITSGIKGQLFKIVIYASSVPLQYDSFFV